MNRAVLDAAAGPLHPVARETLLAAWELGWADPRRLYHEGRQARALLDQAREILASALGRRPDEVTLFPSAVDALRGAVAGSRYAARHRSPGLLASAIEHSSVLDTARYAADHGAGPLHVGSVDRLGRLDLGQWASIAASGEVGAAVLSVGNDEVGTLQPVTEAATACAEARVNLVIDARAALGRCPLPPLETPAVIVADPRAWAGPAGVGVIGIPKSASWNFPGPTADLEGGPATTLPVVPLALAAAEAWQQTLADQEKDAKKARELIDQLRQAAAALPDVDVVGDPDDRLPHILTFSALYVAGDQLVSELDREGFALASGSACTASTLTPSHVLTAMGALTHGNVRVTLPLEAVSPDRADDVARLIAALGPAIQRLRERGGASRL